MVPHCRVLLASRALTKWFALAYVATACAIQPVNAQTETPGEDFVLVRRVIDARYFSVGAGAQTPDVPTATAGAPIDWSSAQLRSAIPLERALKSEVSREAGVLRNDSMQALVLREYGFGKKNSDVAYSAIERKILESNGLERPEDLMAGTRVKIPAIPPMAPKFPSGFNVRNLIPKTSVYADLSGVATGEKFDAETTTYRVPPKFSFALRKGSPLVFQYLWLPKAQVERERNLLGGSDTSIEVHAEIVTARLDESEASSPNVQFPSAQEQAVISKQLAAQPLQSPILLVLDDGWPSDESYLNASRWLGAAFKSIQEKFKYPIGPNVAGLPKTKSTTFPKEKFHARSIEKSLSALSKLEPASEWERSRVRVVYLPMTPAQLNSAGVLEDIVALRLMDDLMGATRGDEEPPSIDVTRFRNQAKQIISRIPKDIGVVDVTTDKAVIESVLVFADLYARATGNPYVANFSWTTPKLVNRYADLRFHYGLLVSAAGNASAPNCAECRPHLAFTKACTCADNVAQNERWFAVRSVDGQDVIAVMNTARNGSLQCRSSIVGSQAKEPMAVALDGNVSADVCGTSFAAPRVAWLAAARLAYFDPKTYFPSEVDRGQQLLNLVKNARVGGNVRDDQFNLDIRRLFNP